MGNNMMAFSLPEADKATIRQTEMTVLAACLAPLAGGKPVDTVIRMLEDSDVQNNDLKEVYKAIKAVYASRKGVDTLSVIQALTDAKKLDLVGGPMFAEHVAGQFVSATNLENDITYIKNQAARARLLKLGQYISSLACKTPGEEIEGAVAKAQGYLDRVLANREEDVVRLNDFGLEVIEELVGTVGKGDDVGGVKTGFRDLDRILGGLHPGEVCLMAGATGMGKTALALNIATNVAFKQRIPTFVLSLEMGKKQLLKRVICSLADAPSVDMRYLTEERKKEIRDRLMKEGFCKLDDSPLYCLDRMDINVAELKSILIRQKHQHGLGLVVIDYVQLLRGNPALERSGNEVARLDDISTQLKRMAVELEVPILELSQLNRMVDATNDKKPTLANIRGTGRLAQDADKIVLLYRKDYYEANKENWTNIVEVNVAKNRDGESGQCKLYYKASTTTFRSLAREDAPPGAIKE